MPGFRKYSVGIVRESTLRNLETFQRVVCWNEETRLDILGPLVWNVVDVKSGRPWILTPLGDVYTLNNFLMIYLTPIPKEPKERRPWGHHWKACSANLGSQSGKSRYKGKIKAGNRPMCFFVLKSFDYTSPEPSPRKKKLYTDGFFPFPLSFLPLPSSPLFSIITKPTAYSSLVSSAKIFSPFARAASMSPTTRMMY